MLKNEYLLQQAVNCTIFRAFFSEMRYNMLLNAVRFGAKCKAKWCKMQCKMVQDAMQNAAKRETKSIKIHCNGINKPLSNR